MKRGLSGSRRPGGVRATTTRPKARVIVTWLVALLLSVAAVYANYQRYFAPEVNSAPVQTVAAQVGTLVSTVTASGSVVLSEPARLGFSTGGKLIEVDVRVGDTVKSGQLLAKLDTQALRLQETHAAAALQAAQIRLRQLKDTKSTTSDAAAGGAASGAEAASNQQSQVSVPAAQLQADQNAVNQAQANLRDAQTRLRSIQTPYTTADVTAARAAVDQAQATVDSAQKALDAAKTPYSTAELIAAQAAVDSASSSLKAAQANLAAVKAGPLPVDVATQQAAVAQAYADLMAAQDQMKAWQAGNATSTTGTSNSQMNQALQAAQTTCNAAVARLNQMMAGPSPSDLQSAQSAVTTAQANYNSAVDNLNTMKSGPAPVDVNQAQGTLNQARANLAAAQARYSLLQAGADQAAINRGKSAVDQATAQLASAQARLDADRAGAQQTAAATSTPSHAQASPTATAGPSSADLAQAEQQVTQAQATLDQATANLNDGTLTAPFDGVVTDVTAIQGDQVGTAPIITLIDPSSVHVDVTFDESDVARLSIGQPATITLDALQNSTFKGNVIAIAPSGASQVTVGYLVSVSVKNPPQNLSPGAGASITIETQRREGVLVIPAAAVEVQGQTHTVQVVPGEKGAAPITKQVQIGAQSDEQVEIVSGLNTGDRVIVTATPASQP
jgi:HlyD family secretion protein